LVAWRGREHKCLAGFGITEAGGTLAHPRGAIVVAFRVEGDGLRGSVELLAGVHGVLRWNGRSLSLRPGPQLVEHGGA
jgi:hypothetical protein